MALFLVQHGRSASKDVDPEKGLTSKGIEETELITEVARGYEVNVRKIIHSGKKRAAQTADLFRDIVQDSIPVEQVSGIAPLDDVRDYAKHIDPAENCMVVGHMPFLERLLSFLTTGSPDIKVYHFQNSGIVCLDAEKGEDGGLNWYIKWTLNPTLS
ncbi:phosphohistidine phosphatase SixA [Desulfopila inferna]|uniref:phosphohistidine phosphatase SixA n=1 Tax=Desulfopila inferna TaxID=468528 RepID=UPI0019657823|nr:phosphohistidine phosphatase SixA [Desulfopila inferna]MBM9605344.1 phosphohistidine phosphatase SixA [Desulfopila inferna]